MITLARSEDTAYFLSVLNRPGIWKAVSAGLNVDPEAIFYSGKELICYEARDGQERRGFIIFEKVSSGVWCIHNVLLTIGLRSIRAIALALKQIVKDTGCHTVVTYVPPDNKAALKMAQRFAVESNNLRPFLAVPKTWAIYSRPCQQH